MEGAVSRACCATERGEENHEPEQRPAVTDKLLQKLRKKKGDLTETLDRTLEPRLPPGRPGRPKGSATYEWTPEMDDVLKDLSARLDPSTAKHEMQKKLVEMRCPPPGQPPPRPDSLRNAV